MKNLSKEKAKHKNSSDKHNDNVVCYVFWEVILCH